MPAWSSNDPSEFGWTAPPPRVVPFVYRGHPFPQGVDARLVGLFTRALNILCRQAGFMLHSGAGLDDGDWGYEYRQVTGGGSLSFHSYGGALDVNAPWNPYGTAIPAPSPYRLPSNTGALLRPLGILWGGGPEWGEHRDWMHMENHNTPTEVAELMGRQQPPPPFPLRAGHSFGQVADNWTVNGAPPFTVANHAAIQAIQRAVGTASDGLYGPHTAAAVLSFQRRHGLTPDGLTGPNTWAALL